MPNLVYLNPGPREEPFTTSEIIAAGTGLQHHTITRYMRNYPSDFETFGTIKFMDEVSINSSRGRPKRIYHLNEEQTTLLFTFLPNTPIVRAFKVELVRQFFLMREELRRRAPLREAIKPVRRELTDAVKEQLPGDKWAYKRYMDLAYIITLGQTAKKIREERGAAPKANATEFLNAAELSAVTKTTQAEAVLLDCGFDYHQAKTALQNATRLRA